MKRVKEFSIKQRFVACDSPEVYSAAIRQPSDAAKLAMAVLGDSANERFLVIHLDIKNKPLGFTEVGRGSVDSCQVDPREVFRAAIMLGASGIIVAHCHPSGDTAPSKEDIELTRRVKEAGKMLGLPLLDHIIIAGDDSLSMAEKGLL